jgi:prepilin-type N-terminal cleavage/methylation domain-containing protein
MKNQKGFSAVEVLLVLVIIGLIGVVGFIVYQNPDKKSDKTTTTTTPSPQTTESQTPTTVKLSADHYSFTAPSGWAIANPKPQLGNDFKDSKGNIFHVEERGSASGGGAYGTIAADFIWLVKDDSNQGVTVVSKSPACSGAAATYEGLSYECDSDDNTTKVAAFMQAEGGEVLVNGRLYVLEFTNSTSGSADTAVFQNILGTFIGDSH